MQRRKKQLAAAGWLLCVLLTQSFAVPVRSAAEPDYPPLSVVNSDGKADGFSVELLRATLAELGLDSSFQTGYWSKIKTDLAKGRLDVLPLVARTPEQEALFDFTIPYLTLHGTLFVRDDNTEIRSLEDLKGRRIAVMKGDAAEEYVRRAQLSQIVISTRTFTEAFQMLSDGRTDAVIAQKLVGISLLKETGLANIRVMGNPIEEFKQEFCFAVKKGDAALLSKLNEGLSIVTVKGTHRQLMLKWLHPTEADAVRNHLLVFSDDFASPPYSFFDEKGRPTGFNVELLRAIAKKVGLTVSFELVPWGEIPDKMKSDKVDISCMHYPNPEREVWVDFSTPHSISYRAVFARRDSPPYKTPEDLKGRRISAQWGGGLQAYAQRLGGGTPTATETLEGALTLLEKGRVDFALCRLSPGLYWIHKNGWKNLYAVDPHLQKSEYCYVVRKGDAVLLDLLNDGLLQIKESGEYRQIYNQWLGVLESETNWVLIKKISLIACAVVALLTIVISLFILSLKRQVKKRTVEIEAANQSLKESRQAALNLMEDTVLAKERLELTQFALDHAADAVFRINQDSTFAYVNQAACRSLGYSQEELLRMSVQDIDPDFPAERWPQYWQELELTKDRMAFESRHRTKNGRIFPVEISSSYMQFGGRASNFVFVHDITERKEAESALIESEKNFRDVIETLPLPIYLSTGIDQVCVYANPAFIQLFGYTREEISTAKDWFLLAYPDETYRNQLMEEWTEKVLRVTDPKVKIEQKETVVTCKDGSKKTILWGFMAAGENNYAYGIDITERKEAEKRLRFEQDLFRSFMEVLPANVYFKDTDSRFVYVNQRKATRHGLEKEALIGKTDSDFFPEDQARKKFEDEQRVMKTQQPIEIEELSGPTWHLTIKAPRYDADGNIAGTFGVSWNITERKQIAEALQNSEARYRLLFENMTSGFALHDVIYDEQGNPSDYRWLKVNPAFEKLTGLSAEKVVGHTAKEILPNVEDHWIKTFGAVAKTGESTVFENYSKDLGKYFETRVFRPAPDQFAVIFIDVTERTITRQKLEESRQFLRTVIDSIPIRVFWKDRNSTYLGCNLPFAHDVGIASPEGVVGKDDFDLAVPKEQSEAFRADDRAVVESGTPKLDFEEPQTRLDGNLHWLKTNKTPLKNIHGEIIGVIGTYQDITEHKRMEEAIRESAELFRLFMQHSPVYTYIKTVTPTESRVLQASDNFQQMIGIPGSEMVGKTMTELFPPELALKIMADDLAVVTKSEVLRINEELNGRSYTSIKFPIVLDDRKFLAGYTMDITEDKKNKAELLRLSTAIEQSPDAIMITGADRTLQYVNPAFETITGYSREEALGKNPRFLKSGNHDADFYSKLWETITSGKTWEGHLVNKRKNGELYTEAATISPVRDSSGTITGYVAVKRDITQELVQEEKFRQSQKMDAIGQLTGGIAHDFNNILQAILGFSEILLIQLNKDSREYQNAFEVQKSAKRAAEMIRQLLAFSRNQTVDKKRIDLNATVRDIEVLLKLLLGDQAKLTFVTHPALHEIYADHSQLTQVIMNLAVNARDAMPDGGSLTITTENVTFEPQVAADIPEAEPGSFVCLSVTDTGCGMNREVKARLFEPFFTTKAVGQGTGLGLAVVYGIVKQNKGWIHVDSEEGVGTTMKIYLPACETPAADNKLDQTHNERILLAGEAGEMRDLVIQTLEAAGYKSVVVASAEEAVELFKQQEGSFDLLFSDILLPGENGIALADTLRKEKPSLPVLLYGDCPDQRERWLRLGSKNYYFLQKPSAVDSLLTAVHSALAGKIR